jgi:hypothetical protein
MESYSVFQMIFRNSATVRKIDRDPQCSPIYLKELTFEASARKFRHSQVETGTAWLKEMGIILKLSQYCHVKIDLYF